MVSLENENEDTASEQPPRYEEKLSSDVKTNEKDKTTPQAPTPQPYAPDGTANVEASSSSSKQPDPTSKPIVIELQRGEPNGVLKPGKVRLGSTTKTTRDIIMLSSTTQFWEFWNLMLKRMREREMLPAQSEEETPYGLLTLWPDRDLKTAGIAVDQLSWEAGRELLLTREEAVLFCKVAVAPKGYEKMKAAEGGKVKKRDEAGEKRKRRCVIQ